MKVKQVECQFFILSSVHLSLVQNYLHGVYLLYYRLTAETESWEINLMHGREKCKKVNSKLWDLYIVLASVLNESKFEHPLKLEGPSSTEYLQPLSNLLANCGNF